MLHRSVTRLLPLMLAFGAIGSSGAAVQRKTVRLGTCSTCLQTTTAHTKVLVSYPNTNYGWNDEPFYAWNNDTPSLHYWDLSAIPAGANVVGATIRYYFQATAGWSRTEKGVVAPITDPDALGMWDAPNATWNYRNVAASKRWSASGGALSSVLGTPLVRVYYEPWNNFSYGQICPDEWDATNLVKGWLNGSIKNQGIALAPLTESGLFVNTDHYETTSERPFLEVTYETGSGVSLPAQVSDLRVTHVAGRTVITWQERTASTDFAYRIYRGSQPISVANVHQAELVAEVRRNGTANAQLREEAEGGSHNWVARDGEGELADGTALHVHAPAQSGSAYYAVTYTANGQENDVDFSSANSAGPVAEVVGDGKPVLQTSGTESNGRARRIYAFWPGAAMSNDSQFVYLFRVVLPVAYDDSTTYPLYFVLGGYGTTYMDNNFVFEGGQEVCIYPECRTPYYSWMSGALTDWFIGYRDNLASLRSVPSEGTVRWYGVKRSAFIRKSLANGLGGLSIDINRIYLWGGSQGGTGALFTALLDPSPWAASQPLMPAWNFYRECASPEPDCWELDCYCNNWTKGNFGTLYGFPSDGILKDDAGVSVWDRLNAATQLTRMVAEGTSPPPLLPGHAWNDTTLLWDEDQLAFIEAAEAADVPYAFRWNADGHFQKEYGALSTARLNRATIGLSHCSVNGTPPPAFAVYTGDTYPTDAVNGWYNGSLYGSTDVSYHAGADYESIQETSSILQVTLYLSREEAQSSATVDVTPHRTQQFHPRAGDLVAWENRDSSGVLVGSGSVTVDSRGWVTVRGVVISKTGNTLKLTLNGQLPSLRGDANGDGSINVSDVFFLINFLYSGGAPPATSCGGDANSDGSIAVTDVFYLINFLFSGGPAPAVC